VAGGTGRDRVAASNYESLYYEPLIKAQQITLVMALDSLPPGGTPPYCRGVSLL